MPKASWTLTRLASSARYWVTLSAVITRWRMTSGGNGRSA